MLLLPNGGAVLGTCPQVWVGVPPRPALPLKTRYPKARRMNLRLGKHQGRVLKRSDDVYAVMLDILLRGTAHQRRKEHFWVMGLGEFNELEYVHLVAYGAHNRVIIEPRDVFGPALTAEVRRLVLVHNHPSGHLVPSAQDVALTRKFYDLGTELHLEVADHYIITEAGYINLADHIRSTQAPPLSGLAYNNKWQRERQHYERKKKRGRG